MAQITIDTEKIIQYFNLEFKDFTTIILAIVAFIVAYLTWTSTKTSNQMYIDELIQNSLTNYRNTYLQGLSINLDEDHPDYSRNKHEIYLQSISESREEILNAYNRACSVYLQGFWIFTRIDRKLFESQRREEILGIVRDPIYSNILGSYYDSSCPHLIKVFDKLKNK